MFYRYLFALAAVLCAAAAYAVEPPVIRETVEPPSIKGDCGCVSTGAPCLCDDCGCTVPVIADAPEEYIIAPPRNPFATENCPDGNCARGSAPRIVGTAGVVRSVYGLSDRPRLFSGEGRPVRRLLGVVFRPFRGLRGGCCN